MATENCNITEKPCPLERFCGRCDLAYNALLDEATRFNLRDVVKLHDHNFLGTIAVSSVHGNVLSRVTDGTLTRVMRPSKFRYFTETY